MDEGRDEEGLGQERRGLLRFFLSRKGTTSHNVSKISTISGVWVIFLGEI